MCTQHHYHRGAELIERTGAARVWHKPSSASAGGDFRSGCFVTGKLSENSARSENCEKLRVKISTSEENSRAICRRSRNFQINLSQPHDCMDAEARATQEPLPPGAVYSRTASQGTLTGQSQCGSTVLSNLSGTKSLIMGIFSKHGQNAVRRLRHTVCSAAFARF